jgi:hypothetical protein
MLVHKSQERLTGAGDIGVDVEGVVGIHEQLHAYTEWLFTPLLTF